MTLHEKHWAFTLIELLVVISIIALLIGILLPALAMGRDAAQTSICLSGQRQLAIGVSAYAGDYDDHIPRGPDTENSFIALAFGGSAKEDKLASSIILNTSGQTGQVYLNAHGTLLLGYLEDPHSMFCPGDDTADPIQELEKVRTWTPPAFSSYVYRNLDQAPKGRLGDMGTNDLGVPATALGFDSNSIFRSNFPGPSTYRTNHEARIANAMYVDGHAKTFDNTEHAFSLTAADYAGWTAIEGAYNRFLQYADANP